MLFRSEQTGEAVWGPLAGAGLLLPWLLAWPLIRMRGLNPLLLLGLLPVLQGARPAIPEGGVGAEAVAGKLWTEWQAGSRSELPEGSVVTVFLEGKALRTVGARDPLPLSSGNTALLVEVPVGPTGGAIWPGRDAPPGTSPHSYARTLRRREWAPGLKTPYAPSALRYQAALASASGVVAIEDGWSPAPELSVANLLASVRSGAHFLTVNQQEDGRFTYIVLGPSGNPGSGYNYPRHAGTAWFLARAAAYFRDEEAGAAAEIGRAHV